jgi:hypothetical protein
LTIRASGSASLIAASRILPPTPSAGTGTAGAPATVADSTSAFVELTVDTVTDDMVRAALADARESGHGASLDDCH